MQNQREPTSRSHERAIVAPEAESPARAEELFSDALRSRRRRQGLSQAGLAEQMTELGFKFDDSIITRIEGGKRSIRLNEAVALAHLVGATISEMVDSFPTIEEKLDEAKHRLDSAVKNVITAEQEREEAQVEYDRVWKIKEELENKMTDVRSDESRESENG